MLSNRSCLLFAVFLLYLKHGISQTTERELTDEEIAAIFGGGESSSPLPSTAGTTPQTVDNKGGEGGSLDPTAQNGTCEGECVPYYLCTINGTIITSGEDIFDIRGGGECPNYLDVCCREENGQKIVPSTTPAPDQKSKGCGFRNEEGIGFRIKEEDREAQFGEFPWMVAVLYQQTDETTDKVYPVYQCGGALIHPQVVMTAAHCVLGGKLNGRQYHILAGEWDTQTTEELYPHQRREVKKIITHENYYSGALYNDVALLILETPVEYAENVDTVCLPAQGHIIDKSQCFATGWGKDVFGKKGQYATILKKIGLPYMKRDLCQERLRTTRLGKYFKLHESFVCAGGEEGKDACAKDGGSPLVCPIVGKPGRYFQAGIVAWGIGCGEPGIPGVYVNVALFKTWIDKHMAAYKFETSSYTLA